MSRPLRVLITAGEASGDRLGAGLARALRRLRPDVDLLGMGGPAMAEAGVRIVQDASEVAVVGLVEVLSHLPAIRRAMARLEAVVRAERPDVLVPVDFPDFNLRLARRARRTGTPVVYFVSPQVWAWRRGRVRAIRGLVRRVLVLFPFEVGFYESAGIPVSFVGHPLAATRPAADGGLAALTRAGLDPVRPVVALLPGSRPGEVARHLPLMLEAARRLRAGRPRLQFVVPLAPMLPVGLVREAIATSGLDAIAVHEGDYPEVLAGCAAGAVASGTATLDAALAGLPFVAVYRMQPLTYLLARLLVKVDHVALPNLVAGTGLVPELLQGKFTPEALARSLERYLDDPAEAGRVRRELLDLRERLGGAGAYERAAEAVLREADAHRAVP